MSNKLIMNLEKIQKENERYAKLCKKEEALEKVNSEISADIMAGKGIFKEMELRERKTLLGLSALAAELSSVFYNPYEKMGEEGNKMIRYQIRQGAVISAFEMVSKNPIPKIHSAIVDYTIMKFLDFNMKAAAEVNFKSSIFSQIKKFLVGKVLENYLDEMKNISHTYVKEYFENLKNSLNDIWNQSEIQKLYGDDGIKGLEIDIGIFEYINHKSVDYIFDEKINKMIINIGCQIVDLMEVWSKKKISLKEVLTEK